MQERIGVPRLGEEANEVDGIALEHFRVGDVEPIVVDAELRARAHLPPRLPVERPQQPAEAGRRLELLHLQRRAQDRRQIADVLGDEEVVLHEALDRAQAAAPVVAELLREPGLHVEGQQLLGAAALEMQIAANRPEEVLALAEGRHLVGLEDAGGHRRRPDALAIKVLREPVQRMQVAQAALAILDVGLDLVAALARGAMALVALGHLGIDEVARRAGDDLVAEALLERHVEIGIAVDEAGVEQRRADGNVGGAQLDALADRARGVADLEAEIPEHVENVLCDALAPRGLLVGQKKQQIDIGAGRQQPAPVAARRHDRHALGIGRVGRAIDVRDRVIVEHADELILEHRQPRRATPAVAVALQTAARFLARALNQRLKPRNEPSTRRGRLSVGAEGRAQLLAQLTRVEIGSGMLDHFIHGDLM